MSNLVEIQNELQSKRKELHHEINRIDAAITALSGLNSHSSKAGSATAGSKPRRVLSLGARRRIAAAQRARWAKVRAQKKAGSTTTSPKPRRVLSLGARRRIAAAQRARWAKVRAEKKAA